MIPNVRNSPPGRTQHAPVIQFSRCLERKAVVRLQFHFSGGSLGVVQCKVIGVVFTIDVIRRFFAGGGGAGAGAVRLVRGWRPCAKSIFFFLITVDHEYNFRNVFDSYR